VKTDLQEDGLVGPVRAVQIATAGFSNHSGHWVEEPRGLPARITYDVRGNRIEGGYAAKTLHTYNAQGNRLETMTYGPAGALIDKTRYTYDDTGRLIR